jgi:hypothetical protein
MHMCVCVGSTHVRMHVASMRVRFCFCLRAKCVYLSTGVSKPGAGEEQEEQRRRGAGEREGGKRRGSGEEEGRKAAGQRPKLIILT